MIADALRNPRYAQPWEDVAAAVREYLTSDEAVVRGAWALAKFGDIGEPSDWDRDAVEQVARALGGDDT